MRSTVICSWTWAWREVARSAIPTAVILRLPKDTKCRRTVEGPPKYVRGFSKTSPVRRGSFDRPPALRVLRRLRMTVESIRSVYNRLMRKLIFVTALLLVAGSAVAASFEDQFLDKTMRVNYFHTGSHGDEIIALDSVVSDGPWPGSHTRLIDPLNLGNYYFEVIDRDTNQPIYSRGFASVFGEWQTTDEAKDRAGTFAESVRFPWPRKPVQLIVKKRDSNGAFQQIFSTLIDPASRFVNPSERKAAGHVWDVIANGPASEKVDLL